MLCVPAEQKPSGTPTAMKQHSTAFNTDAENVHCMTSTDDVSYTTDFLWLWMQGISHMLMPLLVIPHNSPGAISGSNCISSKHATNKYSDGHPASVNANSESYNSWHVHSLVINWFSSTDRIEHRTALYDVNQSLKSSSTALDFAQQTNACHSVQEVLH